MWGDKGKQSTESTALPKYRTAALRSPHRYWNESKRDAGNAILNT